jgi:hypothetical protein
MRNELAGAGVEHTCGTGVKGGINGKDQHKRDATTACEGLRLPLAEYRSTRNGAVIRVAAGDGAAALACIHYSLSHKDIFTRYDSEIVKVPVSEMRPWTASVSLWLKASLNKFFGDR